VARLIPAAERIKKARALIQKARDIEVPAETGRFDFSYVAQVKMTLQQARDMVKFISYGVTTSDEMKAEVQKIFEECDQANKELLHG
jgi:uncharacterized protein (UPF0128 family)